MRITSQWIKRGLTLKWINPRETEKKRKKDCGIFWVQTKPSQSNMKQITLKMERVIVRARDWLHGKSTHDALQADISDCYKADLIKAKFLLRLAGKKTLHIQISNSFTFGQLHITGWVWVKVRLYDDQKISQNEKDLKRCIINRVCFFFFFYSSLWLIQSEFKVKTISFIMSVAQFWVFCF